MAWLARARSMFLGEILGDRGRGDMGMGLRSCLEGRCCSSTYCILRGRLRVRSG